MATDERQPRSSKRKRPPLKWWIKNWPKFLMFCCAEAVEMLRILAKSITWVIVIGAFIVLTSITDSGWQELADVLFKYLTIGGIIRDVLFVILGVAMGRSLGRSFGGKRRNKAKRKVQQEKEQVPEKTQVTAEAQPVEPPKE